MATQTTAAVPNQQVNINNVVPSDDNKLDPSTKRKLIIIGVIAVVITIIVIIVAALIEYNDIDVSEWCDWCGDNISVEYEGEVNYACGVRYDCDRSPFIIYTTRVGGCFDDLNDDNCAELCADLYDMKNAFYIGSTGECYCYSWTQYDKINAYYSYNKVAWDTYCFNTTERVKKYRLDGYIYEGRPYYKDLNINTQILNANIKQIDCNKYNYKWIQFINQNHSYINNNVLNDWIKRGISEHASIATFNKFILELMNIGAPLWLIELANKASIDEIKHTQISFDIINYQLMFMNYKCVIPGEFPEHNIDINNDWNKISKDTVIGGCFGETLSALTILNKYKYNNIIDQYLYEIAMDEINHSALAWLTIKWMINNHVNNMDIIHPKWWDKQLIIQSKKLKNEKEYAVYIHVISSIIDTLWIDMEYKQFYDMIVEKLRFEIRKEDNHAQCVM